MSVTTLRFDLRRVRRVASRHKLGMAGLVILLLTTAIAVLAPRVAPYPPAQVHLVDRLLPPLAAGSTTSLHLLGTDQLGRDVLSRLVYGARVSLIISSATVVVAGCIGFTAGISAGYWGGPWDLVIMRIIDLQLAFPFMLLALAIVSLLGPSVANLIVVFVVTSWPVYARTARASVLVIRSQEYVEAARSLGARAPRIFLRYIVPNIVAPVAVVASFQMAQVIIVEAALGFLGLGVPPPTATWGNMLADGRVDIQGAWWLSLFPGLAITLVAAGVNFVGDAVRDAMDPRLR